MVLEKKKKSKIFSCKVERNEDGTFKEWLKIPEMPNIKKFNGDGKK